MNPFQTVDAETLMTTFLPPTRFVIERLLPQGLHILAGAPKVGKSWLALWLCLCVAKGEPVWEFKTNQGGVLYLCLEDSYARVQNRMFQITDLSPECRPQEVTRGDLCGFPEKVENVTAERKTPVKINRKPNEVGCD